MSPGASLPPDEWRRANDIFHRALEHPIDRRRAFLVDACAGHERLRLEVESLLAAHEQAGAFLEQPVAVPPPDPPATSSTLAPGHVLGQYRIERVLGRGGMGVVYLADDLRLGRKVALKAVAPEFVGDGASRERLRREARAAAALTHPGIATVYALEELDSQVLIAGEYVPGDTLRDELERGPLSPQQAIDTGLQIARALAAAHDHGVIHRDLKPENVIRTPAGDVKILDFGLARMRDATADSAQPSGGRFAGTPAYMSPEQIRGATVDARADLFAFGVLMYECLTGENPFRGSDPASTLARILETEPATINRSLPTLQSGASLITGLSAIVRTCLRKDPGARYASAHVLISALEAVASSRTPVSLPEVTAPPAPPTSTRSSRWWWQFHQGATSAGYLALLIPLWLARGWIGGRGGLVLFLLGLAAALAAVILRLHLWFTVRAYPAEWTRQRRSSGPWLRLADALFVVALFGTGLALAGSAHGEGATLLIAAAVTALIAFAIIEPATTRAAFG